MTVKERLHRLVDALPESELATAAHVLEGLRAVGDPVAWALDHAPEDDEPVTDAERATIAESWAAYEGGEGKSTDDVKRERGLA